MADALALDIAAWILGRSARSDGTGVTPLKLQKLLYYAQAWSLALDGRPLFRDEIQAWAHGPVVPSVYDAYRGYGWRDIEPPAQDAVPSLDELSAERLARVLDVYGELSGTQLERMAHAEAPWREARRGLRDDEPSSAAIPHDSMARYYRSVDRGPASVE